MSIRLASTQLLASAILLSAYAGHGIRGDAISGSGGSGPSPLVNDLSLPTDAGKEYRWSVVAPPADGTLVVYEDGSYTYTAPPGTANLTVTYTYRVWQDGADIGTATETIIIGAGSGGDLTVPTMTGSIAVSALTSTSYSISWPAGSDNVAVTSYERSTDGGVTWVDVGNVLSANVSGRTPGTIDAVYVRAKDAAGNVSAPLMAAVTLASVSITTDPLTDYDASVLGLTTIDRVAVLRVTDNALVATRSNVVTDVDGVLVITDAALVPGTRYMVLAYNVANAALMRGAKAYTAA